MLSYLLFLSTAFSFVTPEMIVTNPEETQKAEIGKIQHPLMIAILNLNLPDRGYPSGRRRGAASRQETCPAEYLDLTALIPETNFGLTWSNNPSFWYYIPEAQDTPLVGELVIQNSTGEQSIIIHRDLIELDPQGGIFKISPDLEQDFEDGETYTLFFKIYCDLRNPEDYNYVSSQIQKNPMPVDIETEIVASSLSERLQLYAEYGVWYDLVSELGQELLEDPNNADLQEMWDELLEKTDLENLLGHDLREL
jgi:hypothetical protein